MTPPAVDEGGADRSLLPRGLRQLIVLRYRGSLRRMFFGPSKQRAFGLLGLGLMSLYLIPMIASGRSSRGMISAEQAMMWLPIGVLAVVALQAAFRGRRSGFPFLPAEIDLVIPGPFSHRQLLTYQLVYQSGPTILMALWLAAFVRSEGTYLASVIGIALTAQGAMVMIGAVSSLCGLLTARGGWPLLLAVAAVAGAAWTIWWGAAPLPGVDLNGWIAWARETRRTAAVEAVCLPLLPHARTITASSILEAIPWAAAATLINAAWAGLHLLLDRSEIETIVAKSQKRIEAQQAASRSGALMVTNPAARSRLRLPMPATMSGAGPLMWRQWLTVYRGLGPVILSATAAALVGIPAWAGYVLPNEQTASLVLVCLPAMCFALTLLTHCDFRADLEHMAWLKSLPISPGSMVAGQVASSAIVVLVALTLSAAGLCAGAGSVAVLAATAGALAGCVPVAAGLVIIENMVFLVAPTRPLTHQSPGGFDPSRMGRHFVVTLFKVACIAGTVVLAGTPVGLILWLGGHVSLAVTAGVVVLAGVVAGLFMACVKAYRSFDVAADVPA